MESQVLRVSATTLQPPLLSYAFSTQPDPVQVGTPAWLTLAVGNSTGAAIACQQIVVSFPVGTNAEDLIAAADIVVTPAPGWTSKANGGTVTLTAPNGCAEIKGAGLSFEFALTINEQVGPSDVSIVETASSPANPLGPRMASCGVDKFPIVFSLSPLMPVPVGNIDVLYDMPAQLNWIATGAGVSCTLSYQPAQSGQPISIPVPNAPGPGGFTSVPLTRKGDVAFTLTASQSVAGQDEPLILQSVLIVSVETLSLSLVVQPPSVGIGGLAQVTWDAPNAEHCLADDGQQLPASGSAYVILQSTHLFTITAVGAKGQTVQEQATIEVNPAIVANQPGYATIADAGAAGATGEGLLLEMSYVPGVGGTVFEVLATIGNTVGSAVLDGSNTTMALPCVNGTFAVMLNGVTRMMDSPEYLAFQAGANGSAGGPGVAAELIITLPPLDTSAEPERVIPITLRGGNGGTGGSGGTLIDQTYAVTYPVSISGGNGGDGGDVRLEILVDPSLPPAQYILSLAAGAGGAGGVGPSTGTSGQPGMAGTVSMAFDGVIVPASGALMAPRAFAPLAVTASVAPLVVPPNGIALLSWNAVNADYCALPDGSIVEPSGSSYLVVAQTGAITVTAHDAFARTASASAAVTVDPALIPTETGSSQTGRDGGAGADGANANWVFGNMQPPNTAPGVTGDTGDNATLTLTIPPLDTTGESTQIIPLTAVGGKGGTGGLGGRIDLTGWGSDMPAFYAFPQGGCPGGKGGSGGNATIALTTDHSQPPAQFIVTITPGGGGAGGRSGWITNLDGSGGPTTSAAGLSGHASLTVDGVAAILPSPPAA